MLANINCGAAAQFQLEVTRPDGTTRVAAPWQNNLITDEGLKSMGTGGLPNGSIAVGTGAGTPDEADTALFNEVAVDAGQSINTSSHASAPPFWIQADCSWQFAQGAAAGNLTELGIKSGGGTLYTHALIKDQAGNPTVITVLGDEVLTVKYAVRLYIANLNDLTGQVTLDAVPTNYTLRLGAVAETPLANVQDVLLADNIRAYDVDAELGNVGNNPSGASTLESSVSVVNGSVTLDGTQYYAEKQLTAGVNALNGLPGGISILTLYGGANFALPKVLFDPPFVKDNTKVFSITFRATWGRSAVNLALFADGGDLSNFTIGGLGSVTVDGSQGLPAPSYNLSADGSGNPGYAYDDTGEINLSGFVIAASAKVTGTLNLILAASSTGQGIALHLDGVHTVIDTIPVGSSPQAIAYDGSSRMYVANAGSDNVSVIGTTSTCALTTAAEWATVGALGSNTFAMQASGWHNYRVEIDSGGTSADVYQDGLLVLAGVSITQQGGFVGMQSGVAASGGNFDNLAAYQA